MLRFKYLVVMVLAVFQACAGRAQSAPEPVNPHATPEARALLAYLDSISGQGTITGQHNFPNDGSRWTDLAYDLTGKYPGLYGEDFGFSAGDDKDSVLSRPAMIEEVKRQYRNGSVIALTWHAVKPTEDEPVTFRESVQGHLTDYEWRELLTPGSPLYNRWCAQVDVIAGYLAQLRDSHVPVLFRPYHEMNGNWFWWGGRPGKGGSAALYRQLYDRFVNVHHLDNLVWVWNVNSPSGNAGAVEDYYPGSGFADVVTMDIYGEFQQEYYTDMLTLAAGKPIALAEVGGLPSVEILARQPRWTYFMAWSGMLDTANTIDRLKSVYHATTVFNRDDPRLAGPMQAIRDATAKQSGGAPDAVPVTAGASAEATALLTRLYAAAGKGILSGQANDPAAPAAATANIVQTTGKRPAIYASDLGVEGASGPSAVETRKAIVSEALRAHAANAIISLSWHAPLPTADVTATPHGQLTDYEWDELLTPGSALNTRWCAQVDQVAASLEELQNAGVAVLWNPYPEGNGKNYWWAGRKGIHGSAELYRRLFDRLVNHNGLHNLIWVWEAAAPDFRPGGAGMMSDFFPGLLYADALAVRLNQMNGRFPIDRILSQAAVGKVIGVELTADLPAAEAFGENSEWSWFIAAQPAAAADPSARADSLRNLYGNPRVISIAPTP